MFAHKLDKQTRRSLRAAREIFDRTRLSKEIAALHLIAAQQNTPEQKKFNQRILDRAHLPPEERASLRNSSVGPTNKHLVAAIQAKYKAQRQLMTDGLTGLWNRRGAVLQFNRTLSEANRLNRDATSKKHNYISIVFIDLDDFGKINKKFGNAAGDQALTYVAKSLMHSRGNDHFVRLGGEEIAGFTTHDSEYGCKKFAERVLRKIRSIQIPLPSESIAALSAQDRAAIYSDRLERQGPYYSSATDSYAIYHDTESDRYWLRLSASIGVSRVHPSQLETMEEFDLEPTRTKLGAVVFAADQGMRYAKAAGKNSYYFMDNLEFLRASPFRQTALSSSTVNDTLTL